MFFPGFKVSPLLTPRSTYSEGEFLYSATVGFSNIERLSSAPDLTGNSFHGWNVGSSVAYGLNRRLAVKGVLSASLTQGSLEGDFYSDISGDEEGDISFLVSQIYLGGTYTLFEAGQFSLPLSIGVLGSYYSLQTDLEEVSFSGSYEGSGDTSLCLKGFLPGITAGVVAEYALSYVTLRLNGALMTSFGSLTGESDLSISSSDGSVVNYQEEYGISSRFGGTYGFSLELFPSHHWHFNLDISDFLPFFQQREGFAEVYTLALTAFYRP